MPLLAGFLRSRSLLIFKAIVLLGMLLIVGELALQTKTLNIKRWTSNEGDIQTSDDPFPRKVLLKEIVPKATQITPEVIKKENITFGVKIHERIKLNEKMQTALQKRNKTPPPNSDHHNSTKKIREFLWNFNFTIDHPSACGPSRGKSIPLLIIVTTAVSKMDSRDAIRSTWGAYAKEKGAKLYFLIGRTSLEDVQSYVIDENHFYQDIIQTNFTDSYLNLTLKSVSLMKWVSERCPKVPFVLKTDDDMLINVDMLMAFVRSKKLTKSIFGKVAKNWKPHRELDNKWHVSMEEYNETTFPDFTTGPAYIFTGDCSRPIYEASLEHQFLFLEDVLLTGIVAQEVGIKRWHHVKMKNTRLKVTYCLFKNIMTSHKHSPDEIEMLWDEVTRTDVLNCTRSQTKPKAQSKPKV